MTPTNCKKILTLYRSSGECEQPETEAAGYHYEFLEYRPGDRINGFVWALVPDDALASSPTDAEIARRVDLLIESCTETIVREPSIADFGAIQWGNFYIVMTRKDHREWACATEDVFKRELRRVAIRQLLSERGAK